MDDLLKIMIVDDEPEARELLKFMLQELEGIGVAGMAGNVDEAVMILKKEVPDLVFLDIQMPDKDGFHFIEMMNQGEHQPGIIFVTAFDNYAIQAIKKSVFDYILKPVRQEELYHAVERFRNRPGKKQKHDLSGLMEVLQGTGTGKIKLNTRSGYILIHPPEVVYCKADGNYTHIQMVNGSMETTTQNLGAIEGVAEFGYVFPRKPVIPGQPEVPGKGRSQSLHVYP